MTNIEEARALNAQILAELTDQAISRDAPEHGGDVAGSAPLSPPPGLPGRGAATPDPATPQDGGGARGNPEIDARGMAEVAGPADSCTGIDWPAIANDYAHEALKWRAACAALLDGVHGAVCGKGDHTRTCESMRSLLGSLVGMTGELP